jgi:hypothetical protein
MRGGEYIIANWEGATAIVSSSHGRLVAEAPIVTRRENKA